MIPACSRARDSAEYTGNILHTPRTSNQRISDKSANLCDDFCNDQPIFQKKRVFWDEKGAGSRSSQRSGNEALNVSWNYENYHSRLNLAFLEEDIVFGKI